MKVIREGFTYEAENFENKDQLGTIIKFVQKERDGDFSRLIQDGTTIEELIDILVSKMESFQKVQSSQENFFIIHYLKLAKYFMAERQREKNKRLRARNLPKSPTI